MDFRLKIEGFTTKPVIQLILDLLGNISNKNLIHLTYLGEKLTSDDEVLCNLRCKEYYTLGYGAKPELPYKLMRRLLEECQELGIYFVTVLGGKLFLYPDLCKYPRVSPWNSALRAD